MTILPSSLNNKIVEGIKQVGIGRKGSKSLRNELIAPIIEEIKSAKATPAQIGAFFAGLFLKGIEADELKLNAAFKKPCLHDACKLVENVVEEMVPPRIKAMAVSLLKGDVLCYSEALSLGRVLFSDLLCDGLRGLTASALRVRYETDDEYAGLLKAIEETREEMFEEDIPPGTPIIQMAEPFDGMDKGYLITPLLANYLVEKGFRVVCLTGKNAGPKDGVCLNHLVEKLDLEKIARPKDLTRQPRLGWYLSVEHYAPPLQRWVDLRRQIVKRPFLATLEKFLNPFDAKLCITSAFHGAYSQKMRTVGERAWFPANLVLRRGPEGALGFSIHHATEMTLSFNQGRGNFSRESIFFAPSAMGLSPVKDTRLPKVSVEKNVQFIRAYLEKTHSGDEHYDRKIKLTQMGIDRALLWFQQQGILKI